MIIKIIEIAVIVTFIIDISGFNNTYKQFMKKIFNISSEVKSLCSLCITWWLSLLYIIIFGKFNLFNIMLCILVACLSPIIKDMYYTITDTIIKILRWIGRF